MSPFLCNSVFFIKVLVFFSRPGIIEQNKILLTEIHLEISLQCFICRRCVEQYVLSMTISGLVYTWFHNGKELGCIALPRNTTSQTNFIDICDMLYAIQKLLS